jgi:hypothetical protein
VEAYTPALGLQVVRARDWHSLAFCRSISYAVVVHMLSRLCSRPVRPSVRRDIFVSHSCNILRMVSRGGGNLERREDLLCRLVERKVGLG